MREADGDLLDLVIEHANPQAVDLDGRRSAELTGHSLVQLYPGVLESGTWDICRQVLDIGTTYSPPQTPYVERVGTGRVSGSVQLSAHRLGTKHLLVTWLNDPAPTPDSHSAGD